jgi:hypothetical protein
MHNLAAPTRALAALALTIAAGFTACGDDPQQRSESNYCAQVNTHLADLSAPVLAVPADIDRVLDAWRTVARSAPLAIEAEWDTMVNNVETASTVDPNDPASMQRVADTARRSEPAANLVITYTRQKCGADIAAGAPATTAPPADPSTADTTGVATTQP